MFANIGTSEVFAFATWTWPAVLLLGIILAAIGASIEHDRGAKILISSACLCGILAVVVFAAYVLWTGGDWKSIGDTTPIVSIPEFRQAPALLFQRNEHPFVTGFALVVAAMGLVSFSLILKNSELSIFANKEDVS